MQHQNPNTPTHPALRKTWERLLSTSKSGILSSRQMTRLQRERLTKAGFLDPLMRGWYRLTPKAPHSAHKSSILDFLPIYLDDRLGDRWCLSAESSLVARFAPDSKPGRMVVMADLGSTTVHTFDDGFRLTIYQDDQQLPTRLENRNGFRTMPLEMILARLTLAQWQRQIPLVDMALAKVSNWEGLVWQLLSEERYQSTTRLAIRLKELGLNKPAETVLKGMKTAGISLPTTTKPARKTMELTSEAERPISEEKKQTSEAKKPTSEAKKQTSEAKKPISAAASIPAPIQKAAPPTEVNDQPLATSNELKTDAPTTPDLPITDLWDTYSKALPAPDFKPSKNTDNLIHRLSTIEFALPDDAINHLALSGYKLSKGAVLNDLATPELAADVAGWPKLSAEERLINPDEPSPLAGEIDPQALVALQGYCEAIRLVKRSIVRLMEGLEIQRILRQDLRGWRLALMGPSAEAGLISRRQVLRYRDDEPNFDMIKAMENWGEKVALCDPGKHRGLLAFLGIMNLRPWQTGNLRMALLIMNALNSSAGLPWVIINENDQENLKKALVSANENHDPLPVANLLNKSWVM